MADWFPSQSILEREAALLAPYAMRSADTAGREYPEPSHPYRGPFQRDRDRIVHAAAYRRLSGKTQVFTGEMGDYHRTRLTHTIEVASIARTIGRALRLNEDLVEALALAHDLGHPPFGHAGEATLDRLLSADEVREPGHSPWRGFNHNRQALRIVRRLETRYQEFPGLNLSREVLAGQQARIDKSPGDERPLLEVQVVDAADSVAYDTHDADDALELGLLAQSELLAISLWREAALRVRRRYANLSDKELRRAVVHELIDWQVSDLLAEASRRLQDRQIDGLAAVRRAPPIIVASRELAEQKAELEAFLHQRVYRHERVLSMRTRVQAALDESFTRLVAQPELLPETFRRRIGEVSLPRTVGDYLAGMTDRYALALHERLTASQPR